jgi:hypothetical protein
MLKNSDSRMPIAWTFDAVELPACPNGTDTDALTGRLAR